MRHGSRVRLLACVACLVLLVFTTPALADDNPLERAMKLRNQAGDDWNAKRYSDAAEKLRKALAIYASTDGEKPMDLAITHRALIWNLVRSGDTNAARAQFEKLMDLVAQDDSLHGEMDSAWGALWEAAQARKTYADIHALLLPVREAAAKRGLDRLAAQVVHSTAWLAGDRKQVATAASLFAEAVAMRRKIGDAVGEAWSLAMLGRLHRTNGALPKALPHLKAAYALTHRERVPFAQQAIAWDIKHAITEQTAAPDKRGVDWLRALAKVSAGSGYGMVVPPSHLERQALVFAEATSKQALLLKTASAIAKKPYVRRAVPEIAADLVIRAARAACRAGKARQARGWLAKLKVGEGPCAPHLRARLATARAIALADKRTQKDFPQAALAAADAWRDLGDFRGRRDALAALVAAATAAGLTDSIVSVTAEHDKASNEGAPGGAGGSASGGGDRSKARALPLDGELFRLTVKDGVITIQDRAAEHQVTRSLQWKPGRVALNGLVLMFFGGYVVVESLNYGGGAAASGAPGQTTLDELGIYMPLPAQGALVIQKNGALRYETGPVSPR